MPLNGSVGYSQNTPIKQEHFRVLLRTHMPIVKQILASKSWADPTYLYLDLNAGMGRYRIGGHDLFGSPLQACSVAQWCDVPVHAFLCEEDQDARTALHHELITFGLTPIPHLTNMYHNDRHLLVTVCPGDYHRSAEDLLAELQYQQRVKKRYGLVYSDENGSCPPFPLLANYARLLPYVDLVIHMAASPIKWQRVSSVHPFTDRLDELLTTIQKTYWLIREPYGIHQWTFLIGTNWPAFPRFRKQWFWPLDSPEGASILRKLSLTKTERREHEQGNLFGDTPWTV